MFGWWGEVGNCSRVEREYDTRWYLGWCRDAEESFWRVGKVEMGKLGVSHASSPFAAGYRDDDDGVLVRLEAQKQEEMLASAQQEWENKRQAQQEGDADAEQLDDDGEVGRVEGEGLGG